MMVKWVVASFISAWEASEGNQIEFPVDEDFVLFCAPNEEQLQQKISKEIELRNKAGEQGCTLEGVPARLRCLGVRKIISICNETPLDMDGDPPGDGTELTYSFMSVGSMQEAQALADGKTVVVRYMDDDDDKNGASSCFDPPPVHNKLAG